MGCLLIDWLIDWLIDLFHRVSELGFTTEELYHFCHVRGNPTTTLFTCRSTASWRNRLDWLTDLNTWLTGDWLTGWLFGSAECLEPGFTAEDLYLPLCQKQPNYHPLYLPQRTLLKEPVGLLDWLISWFVWNQGSLQGTNTSCCVWNNPTITLFVCHSALCWRNLLEWLTDWLMNWLTGWFHRVLGARVHCRRPVPLAVFETAQLPLSLSAAVHLAEGAGFSSWLGNE